MTLLSVLIYLLDIIIALVAVMAGWFWFKASRRRTRRICRHEQLDSADLNRIITNINRTQILNARAALATGLVALLGILRYFISFAGMAA